MDSEFPIPLPHCAVCGRAVDRIYVDTDLLREECVITVRCHGATEEIRISHHVFVSHVVRVKDHWHVFVPNLPAPHPKLITSSDHGGALPEPR